MLTTVAPTPQSKPQAPVADHHAAPLWRLLVLSHDHTTPLHLSLDECIELLDFDADLIANATVADLDEINAILKGHLALCQDHRAELQAWLEQIDQALHGLQDHHP